MFRRPTPAFVIALVALFFSLSGAALAAKDYVINATTDINPKVLKALKGHKGAARLQGPQGRYRRAGRCGRRRCGRRGRCAAGPFPDALPSGKTTRGAWVVVGSGTTDPGETAGGVGNAKAISPSGGARGDARPDGHLVMPRAPRGPCRYRQDAPARSTIPPQPRQSLQSSRLDVEFDLADLGDYGPGRRATTVPDSRASSTPGPSLLEAAGSYAVTAP